MSRILSVDIAADLRCGPLVGAAACQIDVTASGSYDVAIRRGWRDSAPGDWTIDPAPVATSHDGPCTAPAVVATHLEHACWIEVSAATACIEQVTCT